MKIFKKILILSSILFLLNSCEKTELESGIIEESSSEKSLQLVIVNPTIDTQLVNLYNQQGSFTIVDRRINADVINRFFQNIGQEPGYYLSNGPVVLAIGKKRCTKWKNDRRTCIQRVGWFKWKFGKEHRPHP